MPLTALDQNILEAIRSYCAKFNEAEKALKENEILTLEGLAFPVVNELRYAGQHLTRIIEQGSHEEVIRCLKEGERHARRAIYDAYDASILFFLDDMIAFDTDFKDICISPVYPGYIKRKQQVNEIQKQIAQEDRTRDKDEFLQQKKEQLETLKIISEELPPARQELNKLKEQAKIKSRRWWARIYISLFSVLLAGATALIKFQYF